MWNPGWDPETKKKHYRKISEIQRNCTVGSDTLMSVP